MFPIVNNIGNCRDCYRCLRGCELKAISFKGSQARIISDQCILCGKCVQECPQYTKTIIDQIPKLEKMLQSGKVVLSLHPVFWSHFYRWSREEIYSRLMDMGFYAVEEMSMHAEPYLEDCAAEVQKSGFVISSRCPTVVNLIEKHYPSLVSFLIPLENDAVYHAKLLKQKYGEDTAVVHVTPCLSMLEHTNGIDLTLTLSQAMNFIFARKNEAPIADNDMALRNSGFRKEGAALALEGGLATAMVQRGVVISSEAQHYSGLENCIGILKELQHGEASRFGVRFIELNACANGCIGGFGMERRGIMEKKTTLLRDIREHSTNPVCHFTDVPDLHHTYENRQKVSDSVDAAKVTEVLKELKQYKKRIVNCGACGYNSCYEKAVAVARGIGELKMCQTYMRAKAESTAGTAMMSNPSGIIIFDRDFIIQDYNPAARDMFQAYNQLKVGNAVFEYIDHSDFERVVETGRGMKDLMVRYPDIGLVTRQNVVRMQDTNDLFMAIITDITEETRKKESLEKMHEETLEKATKVINNQMYVAQQIAGLLGETTSDTKMILLDLMQAFREEKELKP